MPRTIKRTEGGQGGRKGHSNMTHWEHTEVIKATMKKWRRRNDKLAIKESRRDR